MASNSKNVPGLSRLLKAAAQGQPVLFDLQLKLDRQPYLDWKRDSNFHVVTIESARAYAKMRAAIINSGRAEIFNAASVGHREIIIPHAQFDLYKQPMRTTKFYHDLNAGRDEKFEIIPRSENGPVHLGMPRFMYVRATKKLLAEAQARSISYNHQTISKISTLQREQNTDAVLLSRMKFDKPARSVRRATIEDEGVFVIARPHVEPVVESITRHDFQEKAGMGITHASWFLLNLNIYEPPQIARATADDLTLTTDLSLRDLEGSNGPMNPPFAEDRYEAGDPPHEDLPSQLGPDGQFEFHYS